MVESADRWEGGLLGSFDHQYRWASLKALPQNLFDFEGSKS